MIMIIKKLKKINKSLVKKKLAKIQDSHKNLYLIFKAFEKKILQIEIVYNKQIFTNFFVMNPVCEYLNLKQRRDILMEIDRESAMTKRQGLFRQIYYLMDLIQINYLLHRRLLIRFSYVQYLTTLTMLTTFLINIIITWFFTYKLTRPQNYS